MKYKKLVRTYLFWRLTLERVEILNTVHVVSIPFEFEALSPAVRMLLMLLAIVESALVEQIEYVFVVYLQE